MTGVGVLLGTAAYMPPEQARGKPVDKRADIWAFGCVLFEMLTGKRCFDGEDVSLTLAEVIKGEPNWRALPAATPAAVRSTLKQCLEKDPKGRIRDIGDVRLALDGAFAIPAVQLHDLSAWHAGWRRIGLTAGIGVALGALVATALLWPRPAPATIQPIGRFSIPLPPGSYFGNNTAHPLALTNDGRRLVMSVSLRTGMSTRTDRVLTRTMEQLQPQVVEGLEAVGSFFLSPDGQWIAYNDLKGSLKRMQLRGGQPSTIAATGLTTGGGWQGGTWGSAGTIVFSTAPNRPLMEVPEAGGAPNPRTKPAENESHAQPHFLPDGRSLLFIVRSAGQPPRVAYLPGDSSDHRILLHGTDPRYVATGHLFFTRDTSVWAVAFDAMAGRIIGNPTPVLEGVLVSGNGVARTTVSADGTLAYVAEAAAGLRTVVRVDRQGKEEPLPGLPPNSYGAIRLSPDASRLAFDVGRPRRIWNYDLTRATATPVTPAEAESRAPLWTRDGVRIAFTREQNQLFSLLVQNADGTGSPEGIVTGDSGITTLTAEAWSGDGNTLLVTFVRGRGADIEAIVRGDQQVRDLINIGVTANQGGSGVSPDGQWVAYESDHSGTWEVYVQRFPQLGDRQPISIGGGMSPRWAANGRELFYQSSDGRRILAVPIVYGPSTTNGTAPKIVAGKPEVLFEGQYIVRTSPSVRSFEVLPDGRFLLLKPEPVGDSNAAATVTIVQNWTEELKRLVPPVGER